MRISLRKEPYIIPNYSLTGDLLAYLKCPRQYRYYNRGALPPSTPVQLWFGEFIHGVMEESFDRWVNRRSHQIFPWNWESRIRDIETTIFRRLASRGLLPPPPLFRSYEHGKPVERRLASFRAEQAINIWGPHLFPLIVEAEVRLSATRSMPKMDQQRADYYGITGIVDVVSSVGLKTARAGNSLVARLREVPAISRLLAESTQPFDIIVDYKGMRRPPNKTEDIDRSLWHHQEWQVQTYAWLRKLQVPDRQTVAGVILYLNELLPSVEDMRALRQDLRTGATDVQPSASDLKVILAGTLSRKSTLALNAGFLQDRSIRIVPVGDSTIAKSLTEFDHVISEIETSLVTERATCSIIKAWAPNPEPSTCTACDFKYHCDGPAKNSKINRTVTVP